MILHEEYINQVIQESIDDYLLQEVSWQGFKNKTRTSMANACRTLKNGIDKFTSAGVPDGYTVEQDNVGFRLYYNETQEPVHTKTGGKVYWDYKRDVPLAWENHKWRRVSNEDFIPPQQNPNGDTYSHNENGSPTVEFNLGKRGSNNANANNAEGNGTSDANGTEEGDYGDANNTEGNGVETTDANDGEGNGVENVDANNTEGNGVETTDANDGEGDGVENVDANNTEGNGVETTDANDGEGNGVENVDANNTEGNGVENVDANNTEGNGVENADVNNNTRQGDYLNVINMDEQYPISNALYRLVQNRYLRNSNRVFKIMKELEQGGW